MPPTLKKHKVVSRMLAQRVKPNWLGRGFFGSKMGARHYLFCSADFAVRLHLRTIKEEGVTRISRGFQKVELRGLEPLTFWLPAKRSPS